jgi:non-homologous end joining protein Ku
VGVESTSTPARATDEVNLMDALRRSIEAEKPGAARGKAADRKKPAKQAERRPGKGARKAG